MANWQKGLGEASEGAGIGASIGSVIPGIGTVIGGGIGAVGGLLSGLFSSDDEKPQLPDDPNRGMEDKLINELSSNKQSDATTNAQARARNSFLDTMETYKNSGVGNNAAVLSKLGVKANDQLGENLVNINTADAAERKSNKLQAERMLEQQRNFDMQRNSANIDLAQKPSFLESMGQLTSSKLAGGFIGALNQQTGRGLAPDGEPGSGGGDGSDAGGGTGGFYDKLINPTPNGSPYDYSPTRHSIFG